MAVMSCFSDMHAACLTGGMLGQHIRMRNVHWQHRQVSLDFVIEAVLCTQRCCTSYWDSYAALHVQGINIAPQGVSVAPTGVNVAPQGASIGPTLIAIGPYDTTVAPQVRAHPLSSSCPCMGPLSACCATAVLPAGVHED